MSKAAEGNRSAPHFEVSQWLREAEAPYFGVLNDWRYQGTLQLLADAQLLAQ